MRLSYLVPLALLSVLNNCGGGGGGTSLEENTTQPVDNTPKVWYTPDLNTTWQWQLSGEVDTSYRVDLYDVDLFDTPQATIDRLHEEGRKVICYFSAGSYESWREDASDFPDAVLGNALEGWEGERWLDIRRMDLLAPLMRARLDLAEAKGCDGVEPDNVDGYSNDTGFALSSEDQLQYNRFLAQEAHARGLAVGLKNDLAQVAELESDFDFALNEECHAYDECALLLPFIEHGKPVFNAEYESRFIGDNEASPALCNEANALGLQTLVLPLMLDNSFRYSCDEKDRIINGFKTGFGGGASFKFAGEDGSDVWVSAVDLMLDREIAQQSDYLQIKAFDGEAFTTLQSHLEKARYFTIWLTKSWDSSWVDVDAINRAIEAGKVPVFVYWYFGDELIGGMPTEEAVTRYHENNRVLRSLLERINGEKLLIMEPEFNKAAVLANPEAFSAIISDAIDILKDERTLVSLCMTDTGNRGVDETYEKCGYENCALGDRYEWGLSAPIYNALLDKLDFISFQEMVGQFSRDPADPGSWDNPNPKAYTNEQIGIDYLPQRIENLSAFLYERYQKPVYLPYITIATASWQDMNRNGKIDDDEVDPNGFEAQAAAVYARMDRTSLRANHLFGFSLMELFDDPKHDYGGYQFFLNNEYHLGAIKSSAEDETDDAPYGDIVPKFDLGSLFQ